MGTPSSDSNHGAPRSTLSETACAVRVIEPAGNPVVQAFEYPSGNRQHPVLLRSRYLSSGSCGYGSVPRPFREDGHVDLSVACNVEMIADVAESPVEDVVQSAGFRRKGFPLRRGTAMNDNQCDSSHQLTYSFALRAHPLWRWRQ